jgi:hypothetical protein
MSTLSLSGGTFGRIVAMGRAIVCVRTTEPVSLLPLETRRIKLGGK